MVQESQGESNITSISFSLEKLYLIAKIYDVLQSLIRTTYQRH
jgi:hypothetical protein